ncbi:hypothetical protein SAMN05421823_101107 [Catalinimonas alkaloidigena]|uniref:Uncharacterized protein n=2 Tax=Catalinimonas alkaloidigena TaxID=1075417 RepID=A0A1G8WJI1_9BACT|nr:hypothetical protein SAMN05421823_101107 [Catalinimonas alkaloidigena]
MYVPGAWAQTPAPEMQLYQVTLLTPLGTNGIESSRFINRLSLNIIGGYNGGVAGLEVGGFFNATRFSVHGGQFAGFANIVQDTVQGIQAAGFVNITGAFTQGVQTAGFANITAGRVRALQAAGFANLIAGDLIGIQASGFINVADGNIDGAQASGFANIAQGVDGFQGAGFLNIADGNLHGVQAAGFLNVARKVKGVQLSVINVCDTIDGVPIGLLNIVKKGYRRLEFWSTEALHANMAFKMGANRFYNLIAVGTQIPSLSTDPEHFYWGWGYGIGSDLRITRGLHVTIDLTAYHLNRGGRVTFETNELNQLRTSFSFMLGQRTALFLGPSLNVFISELQNSETNEFGPDFAPWTQWDHNDRYLGVKAWAGFQTGIRF